MISIIIIGNEILSNQIEDHNLKVMLRELNEASYPIDEVRILPDNIEIIAEAVRALSAKSQFVISTGGVGPTHDDITFQAYALAFNVPLEVNKDLEARLLSWLEGKPAKDSMYRMITLPNNAELVDLGPETWPLIKVVNCFVLPGLPKVFDKKFQGLLKTLPPVPKRYKAELYTLSDETEFAASLTEVQNQNPSVEIGSYPVYDVDFKAYVTLKCTDLERITSVYETLLAFFEEQGTLVRTLAPSSHK